MKNRPFFFFPKAAAFMLLVFAACDNGNLPVKDKIEYYRALVSVDTWEDLRQKAEDVESGYAFFLLNDLEASGDPVIIDGKHITVMSAGTKTITRAADFWRSFFEVKNGGSLTVGDNRGSLVLDGNKAAFPSSPSYPASLITVLEGNLVLNNSTLRNNKCNDIGGGVRFEGSGSFTMNNSVISGNRVGNTTAPPPPPPPPPPCPLGQGGGVYFKSIGGGSFTMNNSVILDNGTDYQDIEEDYGGCGGGVFFHCFSGNGSFTMNNSVISENINEHTDSHSGTQSTG
ncbi:MAG: hypothetical protein LBH51_06870, partial [Treponema sp.]|nr:hypothetical protein [Treponema sp.]